MTHELTAIENSVLAALAPMESSLKNLAAHAGEISDAAEVAEVRGLFPCIYVAAFRLDLEPRNQLDMGKMKFGLIVGDRDERGSDAAARGTAVGPGVRPLLLMARGLLHRRTIEINGSREFVRCLGERPYFVAEQESVCIYTAEYEIEAPLGG